ncbi:MAG TPA: S8 family serine peptidase [Mobilitalea sp.]|nr:S8 family serine peptidase [Mobilitalea sp.]
MKRITLKYLILAVLAISFISIAAFIRQNHRAHNFDTGIYNEANGEIVTIFKEEIKYNVLVSFAEGLDTQVEIVRHAGDYALFYVSDKAKYNNVIKELGENPLVEAVQENFSVASMKINNDIYSDTQWALDNKGKYFTYLELDKHKKEKLSTTDMDMDVIEAWEYMEDEGIDRQEVIVAIIDTGIDYKHPDLAENIWLNQAEILNDGIDNDDNGYVDDIYGWDFYNKDNSVCHYTYNEKQKLYMADSEDNDDHGTHIAGIIGASVNNNIGIAGIASIIDIKIMVLKINGGEDGTGSISSAVEAIKYATMMGADICNISWGTSQPSDALRNVMSESDMFFVAAAGNSGTNNNKEPIYPASYVLDNMISVTYVDSNGTFTDMSNYGDTTVDIAAPGDDIFSTVVGSYSSMSGSSMAAPHVSAAAALLYSYYDQIYPSNVKELLIASIKPLSNLEGQLINSGIPSAFQAVKTAAKSLLLDTYPPSIILETKHDKGKLLLPVVTEDKGGSNIRVIRWLSGEHGLFDFGRGMSGTLVSDTPITLEKAGVYTLYASDYAGNDTLLVYEVKDDTTSPRITPTYTVAASYKTRTVSVRVMDEQSGIKRIKYMAGKKKVSDFLPAGAGSEIVLKKGKGSFKVKKDGIYSIFAIDYRGNATVRQIEVKTVKAIELTFNRKTKYLHRGEEYTLRAYIRPANTTDKITYTSSDETIATISKNGKITALRGGSIYVMASTNSGLRTVCRINVFLD